MREMEMENERVERLGEDWIQAVTQGAPGRLEGFCQPEVASILLTPKRYMTLDKAIDLAAKYNEWFGDCSDIQVEYSRVKQVGERLGIFYRFRLLKHGEASTIEQQLYCTLKDGRVGKLHLLCSGFQPVGMEAKTASPALARDGLLEFHAEEPESGSTCAVLTPAISSKLRAMQSGQVLEVRVDDTSARGDIEAWSRLSGNELLKVVADQGPELRFFVKKK